MKTYLVTGAAGFIGANYIKYILAKHNDIKVVILDALTYAGNLGTIAKDIDNERCVFIKGDICSRDVVDGLFAEYRFDYVVNFAAESHVDRSIENPQLFLITNILGTQNLLDCARRAWVMGKDEQGYPTWRKGVRYHQVSTDEVYGSLGAEGYFTEATPLCPHSPYSASKTSADMVVMAYHDTYKMPVTITRCSNNYGPYHFPEKLIPLIIKNILEGGWKKLPAEIIRVTTKRCTGNDSQFINIPIAIRIPISSILREVSPNMLFNFLPLYIFTIRFQVRK